MMNCAEFENRLTDVLGGELEPTAARAALAELERHAAECPDCGAAAGWVELAALPAADRDPLGEPPLGYWDDFNASVTRRIEQPAGNDSGSVWKPLTAAAAIVLALAAGWALRGVVGTTPGSAVAVHTANGEDDWTLLQELILEATPEELAEALSRLPGGALDGYEADAHGAWLPDPDELDEIDQEQLTQWLDQLDELDQAEGRPTS